MTKVMGRAIDADIAHGSERQRVIVHLDPTDRSIDRAQHIVVNDVTLQADTE